MPELTVEFLVSALQADQGQITEAIKDGENFKSESEMIANIKKLADDRLNKARRDARDEGYGRGKKESLSAKEQEIRKAFDLKGSTIDDMMTELADKAKLKPDLTPEDVRNTEIYKLEVGKRDDRITELTKHSDDVVKSYKAKAVTSAVRARVKSLIKEKGYVVSEGLKDDDIVLNAVIGNMADAKTVFIVNDEGKLVVHDDTGQQKLNAETVQPVTFDELALSKLDRVYVIPASDGRGSPGNKNGSTNQAASKNEHGFTKPKDDAEYIDTVNNLKTSKEKNAYVEFVQAQS